MNCFNCHKCGIALKKREFRCIFNFKLIATYTDDVAPHLSKTIIDSTGCEGHSRGQKSLKIE